jgi:hypothetical protein
LIKGRVKEGTLKAFTVFSHGMIGEGIHKVREFVADGRPMHQVFLGSPSDDQLPVAVGLKRNRMPVVHTRDTIFEASPLTFVIPGHRPRPKLLLTKPAENEAGSIVLIEDVKRVEPTSDSQLLACGHDALVTMVPGQSVVFTTRTNEQFELSQPYDAAQPVCRPVARLESQTAAVPSQVSATDSPAVVA